MTSIRAWMNSALIILIGAGLLVALSGLIRHPDGTAAGLAVSAMLTVLAAGMLRASNMSAPNLLLVFFGAMLTGSLVAAVSAPSGGVAQGLCSVGVAGTGLVLLGLGAPRWFPLADIDQTSRAMSAPTGHSSPVQPLQIAPITGDPGVETELTGVDSYFLRTPSDPVFTEVDEVEEGPRQHWSRTLAGSEDRLEGELHAELQSGQKQCYLHVPFIPLFQSRPTAECECEAEGDAEVVAELEQVHPYGARLSVRRRGDCSEPVRLRVHLFVTGQQKSLRAA